MFGAEAATGEAGWLATQRAAERLGLAAVNAAGVFTRSGEPVWIRYGMQADWVESYTSGRMYEVDPVIGWIASDSLSGQFCCADVRAAAPRRQAAEMADLLEDYRYRHLLGRKWVEGPITKTVLFCTEDPAEAVLPPETLAILPAVSAMMAGRLNAPQDCAGFLGMAYRPLSGREKDVLSYLAAGLDNNQIAARLGLAEVTVRMHMSRARKKMGAATREQALALAMARGMLDL
nr:LuxR C-terminal-related transcriptional regulator [Mangrovicoccus sp. HB161399]